MSYEKTNWQTGDVVTSNKLNNIENGVYNSVLMCEDDNSVLNHTWSEITNAGIAFINFSSPDNVNVLAILYSYGTSGNDYILFFKDLENDSTYKYKASSENGYPEAYL